MAKLPSLPIDTAWRWFLTILAVLMLGFAIGPRVPVDQQQTYCIANYAVGSTPIGLSLNCDSLMFMEVARDPAKLFEHQSLFQARPGMMLAAGLLSIPLTPLESVPKLLHVHSVQPYIDPTRVNGALEQGFPAYAAFIILHVATLVVAFAWYRHVCEGSTKATSIVDAIALLAPAALLLANDEVKAFIWSPLPYMFLILIPIASVVAVMAAWRGALEQPRVAVLIGLVGGVGVLWYGLWAIILPAAAAPALLRLWWHRKATRATLISIGIMGVIAIAPTLCWMLLVRSVTGSFYSVEIERYREFIWVWDSLKQGFDVLVVHFSDLFISQFITGLPQAAPAIIMLAIVGIVSVRQPSALLNALKGRAVLIWACLFTVILTALLYAATGLVYERIAYGLVPPLVLAVGAVALDTVRNLGKTARRLAGTFLVLVAGVQVVYVIVKNGPYS